MVMVWLEGGQGEVRGACASPHPTPPPQIAPPGPPPPTNPPAPPPPHRRKRKLTALRNRAGHTFTEPTQIAEELK